MKVGTKALLAGATLALSSAGAILGYRYAAVQHAERAADLAPMLESWRLGLELDTWRLERARSSAEGWTEHASLALSLMQARLLQLEALAASLREAAALDKHDFDFDFEPGLGGPEVPVMPSGGAAFEQWDATAAATSRQIDDRWRQLHVLKDMLRWRDLRAALAPEGRPVARAYISSRFGSRIDPFTGRPAVHKGIDFAGRPGTEIVAVAAGIVTWSGSRAGYGQMVEIDHGNQHVTRYAHNARNLVVVGEVVSRGQAIAELGSSGRATGPNLHFEVLHDGEAVDPLPYVD